MHQKQATTTIPAVILHVLAHAAGYLQSGNLKTVTVDANNRGSNESNLGTS